MVFYLKYYYLYLIGSIQAPPWFVDNWTELMKISCVDTEVVELFISFDKTTMFLNQIK